MIVTEQDVEKYFVRYLASSEITENEKYTYGERINPHLDYLINMIGDTPLTNQATIEIGVPKDILLDDPPCLRVLSWKIVHGKLNLSSFWRSWDLGVGLPVNLCGLQLLNELIAIQSGVDTGKLICYSDGAHLYDYQYHYFE